MITNDILWNIMYAVNGSLNPRLNGRSNELQNKSSYKYLSHEYNKAAYRVNCLPYSHL